MFISLSFVIESQEIPLPLRHGNGSMIYEIFFYANDLHFLGISKEQNKDWLEIFGTEQRENLRHCLEKDETGKVLGSSNQQIPVWGSQGAELQKTDHSIGDREP